MRVLVTGGFGFIGSNVVKLLIEKNCKVWVVDDFTKADFKNLQGIDCEVIIADISKEEFLKKIPKVDAIIHEAAITDTTLTDDKVMMKVNFTGFKNILEYCVKKGIRLIYASSAGVYGNGSVPMCEDNHPNPLNTYTFSKYLCDYHTLKIIKKVVSPTIIGLRYFNVYGPGEAHKGKAASMIYQLYLQMSQNRSPRIFKFGDQKRDFIYVKDVARITVEALEVKDSGIINVGTGWARSFNEVIEILNKVLGKNLSPEYFDNPYTHFYQNYTQADTSRLKEKLNTLPRYSLEEGTRDYVLGYLGNNI